jgi:hypothetical protein
MRFLLSLCLLVLASTAAAQIRVPDGFVLQPLDPTDGQIARPKGWFYTSSGTPSGWLWTLTKEDPSKGPYKTGLRIQMLVGVEKGTGKSRETFVNEQLDEKRSSTKVIRDCQVSDIEGFHRRCLEVIESIRLGDLPPADFHVLYTFMWGTEMDIVVVSIFGAPPEEFPAIASTANAMSEFRLIGPGFGKQ